MGLRLVARDSALRLHDACLDLAAALVRLAGHHATDLAAAILALSDKKIEAALDKFRADQTAAVNENPEAA